MKAHFKKHTLLFKKPAGTSRGILLEKDSWFIIIENNGKFGIGECGLLKGLSFDDCDNYIDKLSWACQNIDLGKNVLWEQLRDFPSIQFGIEQAFLSLYSENPFILFDSDFTNGKKGIPINGLVWMESADNMKMQIDEKIKQGFDCIKLKIGAIDFDEECSLLSYIRKHFPPDVIEIRVDANGAFDLNTVETKLEKLSAFSIHSIEQPIKAGNVYEMKKLCKNTPIPIALDEELIGITTFNDKKHLIETICPQYIILKPSLIGGIKGSEEWISLANSLNIQWWITSALESNIGLNAIAQWTFSLKNPMPQGLGTGSLYVNNINAPLVVKNGFLWYDLFLDFDLKDILK